ncbi:uncharacterized protein LOC115733012 isoform X2 [Rhodamnia argentea]|uniref:Uncharacterized protein LOC115733012 isoform X2 n=1 Tax=Rhodamnia argentea TaxID=178133 RepID=A0ABM3GYT9_9MYRT|nr:uncharacterized protein LOC115733012 isoform X2 [Rhodamnia argentea]
MMEESEKTRLGSENDDEGEEEVKERRKKWLQQYSSHHQILLVGEGDFSFSSSLASAFGSASNVTATSLDPYDDLIRKYKKAKPNLGKLKKVGASLWHGVDATRMILHPVLRERKFDRIIFNFPHAGFKGKEDDVHLINMHRELMHGFFHNASQMLRAAGEVHVRHKTTAPFCHWKLEELASWNSLKLIDQTAFKSENYPGYHNKRGDGQRCDEPFPLWLCSTFKFRFYPRAREVLRELMMPNNAIHEGNRQIYVSPVQMPVEFPLIYESSVQVDVRSEQNYKNLVRTQEQSLPLSFVPFPSVTLSQNTHNQLGMNSRNTYGGISAYHGNIVQEIPQRTCYDDVGFHAVPLPVLTHIQSGMNSGNVYGGVSAYNGNIVQEIPQRTCYDDVGFHAVPLPGLTHIQSGMNSGNGYGGVSAYYGNIVQEIPQRTCYDDVGFHAVPLPGLTHIQSGMNSGNGYGGVSAYHRNIVQEIPQRTCYDDVGFHAVPLPGLTHIQSGMNSGNGYGGVSAYHRNIVQEIPQRTCYDDVGFRAVPLPGLASEQHYEYVERRTSVGDLDLVHELKLQENLRRLIYYFGKL